MAAAGMRPRRRSRRIGPSPPTRALRTPRHSLGQFEPIIHDEQDCQNTAPDNRVIPNDLLCRASLRLHRVVHGSFQAETGSPASQRPKSSAMAPALLKRSSGRNAIALRQISLSGADRSRLPKGKHAILSADRVERQTRANIERKSAGQELIQCGPKAVNVAGGADRYAVPFGLLRAHVGQGAGRCVSFDWLMSPALSLSVSVLGAARD